MCNSMLTNDGINAVLTLDGAKNARPAQKDWSVMTLKNMLAWKTTASLREVQRTWNTGETQHVLLQSRRHEKKQKKRTKTRASAAGEMHCWGRLRHLHCIHWLPYCLALTQFWLPHSALFLLFVYTDNLVAGGIPPSRPFVYFSSPGVVVAVERRTARLSCFFSGQSVYCLRFSV